MLGGAQRLRKAALQRLRLLRRDALSGVADGAARQLSLPRAAELAGADHLALDAGQHLLLERARAKLADAVDDVLRVRVHELLSDISSTARGLRHVRLVGLRRLRGLLEGLLLQRRKVGDARPLVQREGAVGERLLVREDVHRVVRVPVRQHRLLRRGDGHSLWRFAFSQKVQKSH